METNELASCLTQCIQGFQQNAAGAQNESDMSTLITSVIGEFGGHVANQLAVGGNNAGGSPLAGIAENLISGLAGGGNNAGGSPLADIAENLISGLAGGGNNAGGSPLVGIAENLISGLAGGGNNAGGGDLASIAVSMLAGHTGQLSQAMPGLAPQLAEAMQGFQSNASSAQNHQEMGNMVASLLNTYKDQIIGHLNDK